MKNLLYLFCILFVTFNSALAFDYTEDDKNMFYDAFIEGYIDEMTKFVEQFDIEQEKKDKFIASLKSNIDRESLINTSWDCIKEYPIQQIVSASVMCTQNWSEKQINKTKIMLNNLK